MSTMEPPNLDPAFQRLFCIESECGSLSSFTTHVQQRCHNISADTTHSIMQSDSLRGDWTCDIMECVCVSTYIFSQRLRYIFMSDFTFDLLPACVYFLAAKW